MDYYPTLHGMCEVVMNDEAEDAPLAESLDFNLPPVPTFDLQSEQMQYLAGPEYAPHLFMEPDPSLPGPGPVVEEKPTKEGFLKQLFDPIFVSNVFATQSLEDVTYSKSEKMFHKQVFKDPSYIEMCRLHCTICDKHIGCAAGAASKAKKHIMLSVLVCKQCHKFYGDGVFPLDVSDNSEVYCRWCGQGGDLSCCSYCPKVFCNKCVKRNFGADYLKKVQEAKEWACFCCAAKPTWPLRAIWRAHSEYLSTFFPVTDKSTCCESKKPKKDLETKSPAVERTRSPIPIAPRPVLLRSAIKQPFVLLNQNVIYPTKPAILSRPVILPKPKESPRPVILPKPKESSSPRRGRPPMLITKKTASPPSKRGRPSRTQSLGPPRPMTPAPNFSLPSLNQSLETHDPPITTPVVIVNHSYQNSLLVRVKTQRRPDQYIRVKVIGACMRVPRFPPAKKCTFVQHCLKQTFRANQIAYHKLTSIVDNIENLSGNESEDAVLQYLDHWKEMINVMENDVRKNRQKYYAGRQYQTHSNVIQIDDDDDDKANENGNEEGDGLKWEWQQVAARMDFDLKEVEIIEDKPVTNEKTKGPTFGVRKRRKVSHKALTDFDEPGATNNNNEIPLPGPSRNLFADWANPLDDPLSEGTKPICLIDDDV